MQALAAAGWSATRLADRLGVTRGAVASLRDTGQDRVLATTASAITALYEDCWWRTPPGRSRDLARTETWAIRHGWADPSRWHGKDLDDPGTEPSALLDDIDPVAIAEAIAGRRVRLTRLEQHVVADELTRRGASAHTAADAIGRSARSVVRYRNRTSAAA